VVFHLPFQPSILGGTTVGAGSRQKVQLSLLALFLPNRTFDRQIGKVNPNAHRYIMHTHKQRHRNQQPANIWMSKRVKHEHRGDGRERQREREREREKTEEE
jgi:hypothetical protein